MQDSIDRIESWLSPNMCTNIHSTFYNSIHKSIPLHDRVLAEPGLWLQIMDEKWIHAPFFLCLDVHST